MTLTTCKSAILTRNRCNGFANVLSRQLRELLLPYCVLQGNRKIRKISGYGGWTKKVEKQLDQLIIDFKEDNKQCINPNDRFILYSSYSSCILEIKLWDEESRRWQSKEIVFARFNEDTGEVTSISDATNYRCDYTLDELIDAKNRYDFHHSKMIEAQALIRQFSH